LLSSPARPSRTSLCARARSMLNSLRKNVEISGWGLERAGLRAEPYIDFKDLRHDWEAVPFQKSNVKSFPQAPPPEELL
jgi:hypothetical protein